MRHAKEYIQCGEIHYNKEKVREITCKCDILSPFIFIDITILVDIKRGPDASNPLKYAP